MRAELKIFTNIAVALCVICAVEVGNASADDGTSLAGGAGYGQHLLAFLKKVDLSEAQKSHAANVLYGARTDMRKKVDSLRASRNVLFEAVHQDTFDEAAVRAAAGAAAKAEEELAVVRARIISDIRSTLTDSQKQLLSEAKTQLRQNISGKLEMVRGIIDFWVEKHQTVDAL